jgi:hypothetical protein
MMNATITTPKFFFGGNAVFTVHNDKGQHYTFRVRRPKDDAPFFLNVLTDGNNEGDYTYAGILKENGDVVTTRKSRFTRDSQCVKVASWAVRRVMSGKGMPEGYGIHHEGRCCRCGRTLTTPESVQLGIGPECAKKV